MAKTRKMPGPADNILKMPPAKSAPAIERDEVARRAYQIFLARGAADGSDMDDWLLAEQELRAEMAPKGRRSGGRVREG